jgi:hypothetical protein
MPPMRPDGIQRRNDVCNHEAGHAAAMFLYGRPIREIDVDNPDSWTAGHVVPGPVEPIPEPPDEIKENFEDLLGWVDARESESGWQSAVINRTGSLAGGQDWTGPESRADRELVLQARPLWMTPGHWELFVESKAERILHDPVFRRIHTALAMQLARHSHEAMSGSRAEAILREAAVDTRA